MPNNYNMALKRTLSMRSSALKNVNLKCTLENNFDELITQGWIEQIAEDSNSDTGVWYLPFFATKQDKPRVVYDGAALFQGFSLNQIALPGMNLLNGLIDVLIRFRLGVYACHADLSKCFFQVSMPEHQRNMFRLIWFKNNDLEKGNLQVFRFTRHVWGIMLL